MDEAIKFINEYLKTCDLNNLDTLTLFRILDILVDYKKDYLRYQNRQSLNKYLILLWIVASILIGISIMKYYKITGIAVGTFLSYLPYLGLSKINNIEYNELVTKLNNIVDARLNNDSSRNLVKQKGFIMKKKTQRIVVWSMLIVMRLGVIASLFVYFLRG